MMLRTRRSTAGVAIALFLGYLCSVACGEHGNELDGSAGAGCEAPDACYAEADRDEIVGDVQCLDRVPGGYCTHTCSTDADCCVAQGECDGRPQVCAPFESTGTMMCFLSCEGVDEALDDPDGYCSEYASESFTCRSTGGGSNNRKVCA
ncbi:MAG: hypothetical protein KUG77_26630 [Nannocystaceae bacterium]|nr:hypothetical protein [Nannocystaceae bacterium]